MVAVPFPLSSSPGRRPQESGGRIINGYAEPLAETARSKVGYHRSAGLTQFGTTSQTGFRGMIQAVAILYTAWSGKVYKFTSAGGAGVLVGNLTGSQNCFFARNNKSGTPDVVVVAPGDGAFVLASGSVSSYPDGDLPSAVDVCFQDGYFFFAIQDGRCFASGLNDTSINSLDVITAESKSDALYRCVPWNGQLWLFGERSTEVWSSAGGVNATGFPYNRLTVIQGGLAGRYALAGHEDGFGKTLIWVGDDNRVKMLSGGYQAGDISPPDLDRLIEAVSDKHTLKAGVYVSQGKPFWVLSSPDWTWEFNLSTLKWNERKSHLLELWRGTQPNFAFGKWLCGDTESGNLYQISGTTRNEAGEPLRMRVESGPVPNFPNRVKIARIDVDGTTGVGIATGDDPTQTDPEVEVSVSRDGGLYWDSPRLVKLGRQQHGEVRVTATRFGLSGPGGPRVRIDLSDEVDFALMGADIAAQSAAK